MNNVVTRYLMAARRTVWVQSFNAAFGYGVFRRGGRPTHRRGTAARGEFVVDDAPGLEGSHFFRPGRRFWATVRHGNVAHDDDAAKDLRGCALRLDPADNPDHAGLDLIMNTGEVTFSTARVFWDYALASGPRMGHDEAVNEPGLRHFLEQDRRKFDQFASALRRGPESFANLWFYSKLVYRWVADDRDRRYVRFRLRPADGAPETDGIVPHDDYERPWDQERQVGDTRPYGYLREEFRNRVHEHGVHYRLEAQIWSPGLEQSLPVDDPMFDPGTGWDEHQHPWRSIGIVRLSVPLSKPDTETLAFHLERLPPELGFEESWSVDDFMSVPYVRIRTYRVTQSLRSALYRLRAQYRATVHNETNEARGTHGLNPDQQRDTGIWELVLGHFR